MGFSYQDNVNTSLSHTEAYAYDSLNRLTNAQATGSVSYDLPFSYTADGSDGRYGNVTCVINTNTSGPCPAYGFSSGNNRITNSGYTYDAAGDLTSDGTYTYQYDAEGRLNNVTEGGNPFASPTYNARGQMVSLLYQAYGNEQVVGVFDPAGRELGYYDGGSGDWYDREIWAAGRIVAQSFDASSRGGRTQYLHANALGSDSQITIQTGASGYDILFYPWGQYWTHAGSQAGDTRFAGLEQTTAMDSYDTPTRQYGKALGRWLTPDPNNAGADPMNPQSWNAYAYALNNPTTRTDPSGLCTVDSESHNWLWCAAHDLGLTTTLTERRDWLIENNVVGVTRTGTQIAIDWKNASSNEVNSAYGSVQSSQLGETVRASLCLACAAGSYVLRTLGASGAGAVAGAVIPAGAEDTLRAIDETGRPPAGVTGGTPFENDGRAGGEVLPRVDTNGSPITYREWDANPSGGGPRDAERIVTGSDGSAYYTADHYQTFTKMR